jgi:diphthine synthase
MSVNQCIAQLLECEEKNGLAISTPQSLCIGLARVGQPSQCVRAGTMAELARADFGPPLHSFILCGHMHPLEEEYFAYFRKETIESSSCILNQDDLDS